MNTVIDAPRCPPTVIDLEPPARAARDDGALARFCPDCGAGLRVPPRAASIRCRGCGADHAAARFAPSLTPPAPRPVGAGPRGGVLRALVAFVEDLFDPRAHRYVSGLLSHGCGARWLD